MIGFLYRSAVKLKKRNFPGWKYFYKLNKLILNVLYPKIHKKDTASGVDKNSPFIVSLTSFPARIELVRITIASIMNQTMKAGRIILWLSNEQFSGTDEDLPKSLTNLKKRGLEIRYCKNMMPHKKYFYVMQENPEAVVVTIDDDIFYPENHLEMLWKKHLEYPEAVCCWYAHKIKYDDKGKILPYNDWESDVPGYGEPTMQLLAVGCGGVLYPVKRMPKELFSEEQIRKLCLMTDDLWLKSMEVLSDIPVVRCVEDSLIFYGFLQTRHKGLFASNADRDGNDVAMGNILENYPAVQELLYRDFCEKKERQGWMKTD